MAPSQRDGGMAVSGSDSASDSDASSVLSQVFSDNGSDDESASDLESDEDESDDESDSDDDDLHDEGQLSAEEYLAIAENLDVSQLRQKRYSPNTQDKLDETRGYWNRFCRHIHVDPVQQWRFISNSDETVQFLCAFFSWRCDIRRGKNGRHCPGIKYKSSLQSFWKWWHLVLKQETLSGLSKDIIVKVEDVIALVATQKNLKEDRRPKKNMYIEDVSEFARVLLSTTETSFGCGWRRIQLLFYTQLAAITASRPGALLHLRYQDLGLKLIRDPDGDRPNLLIFLKPEFTKRFLGTKAPNEFKIPEIIFDPTLTLSPHVCLLSMLFHIKGFKNISKTGPILDNAQKLYSVRIVDGLNQQELKLKDEILDKYVFCQVERETTGYRIVLEKRMLSSTLRSQMRRIGEITTFEDIVKPYLLRYAGAKEFNNSKEISEALQNVMLQHSDIRTFIQHYEVDLDVDAQGIVRKTGSQTPLVRFACSLSASIDPNRPYKLSTEESRSINDLPAVRTWQDTVHRRKGKWNAQAAKYERDRIACEALFGHLDEGALSKRHRRLRDKLEVSHDRTMEAKRRHNRAVRALRNEKQRQKNQRIRENLDRYRNEQPVIDLECQLAGLMVTPRVKKTLQDRDLMSAQHLAFIDCMMAIPGKTLDVEYQRRIAAIDAGTVFCGVEEGRPTRQAAQSPRRPAPDDKDSHCSAKRQRVVVKEETDNALCHAIDSVRVTSREDRPTICFICVGNPNIPLKARIAKYATPGSLTRHFLRKHVNPPWSSSQVVCHVCDTTPIQDKMDLLSHAEDAHGTVIRGRIQDELASEYRQDQR
ncbi:hypothetical protein TMatcc_006763 [Talaromyces marneffei ATCC 18224]|uniref:Nucleoplasmin, putative n=1 Tax=Talaromyces marneffei (strain ATCC 18224 / CBS 334.59 / QM 7333) TaxID=441960 RepID=B6QCX2_TALMQ|nr:nucleoplasmin, putative [Talaromyces marneffei ATCC 18224]